MDKVSACAVSSHGVRSGDGGHHCGDRFETSFASGSPPDLNNGFAPASPPDPEPSPTCVIRVPVSD